MKKQNSPRRHGALKAPRTFADAQCLSAVAVIFLLAGPALAQAPAAATTQPTPVTRTIGGRPVKVTVHLDRDDVTIPQPLTLKFVVEYERGVDIDWPKIEETFGNFIVKEISRPPATGDDYLMTQEWTLSLEPVLPGDVEVPSFAFPFHDTRERADGTQADVHETATTPPIPVKVQLILADVKAPESLWAPTNLRILAYLLIAVASVVLIGLITRWWRRRAAAPRTAPAAPPVPAHVWALAELDILIAEGLLERGRVQEFYYRINAIVRRYIEMRFNIMAGEQTSEEFIRDLACSPRLVEGHKDVLRRFVSACDPVKYARHQPDKSETDWVQRAAREFIVQTAHAEPPVPPGAPHEGNGRAQGVVAAPARREVVQ